MFWLQREIRRNIAAWRPLASRYATTYVDGVGICFAAIPSSRRVSRIGKPAMPHDRGSCPDRASHRRLIRLGIPVTVPRARSTHRIAKQSRSRGAAQLEILSGSYLVAVHRLQLGLRGADLNYFHFSTNAGLGGLSGTETIVVLGMAFVLFGGKSVTKVGKAAIVGAKSFLVALSEGVKGFTHAMKEGHTRR